MRIPGNISTSQNQIKFQFSVNGVVETQRYMRNFGLSAGQMQIGLSQFALYILRTFKIRFNEERGWTKWHALAFSTINARKKRFGSYGEPAMAGVGASHPILVWTGELMRSYTQQGAFGNYYEVTQNRMEVGSLLNKAFYHHTGNAYMPKRQVAFLNRQDNQMLIKIFHTMLQDKIVGTRKEYTPGAKPVKRFIG